ncbi:MAG: hypothetical protein M1815_003939 [Lichina confinis]|nr:MAG: hypothetical protein M1815_003939 [Lichina confinis]
MRNGRVFDVLDIAANVVGSLAALALCSWYHRRMIERKRQARRYQAVPGDDVELGEGTSSVPDASPAVVTPSLDHEVDNWDENIEDDDDPTDVYAAGTRPPDGEANAEPATPSKERSE